ncbi:condensin complex subunit 3-like isoform X2 [Harmonia axyridis]|uniref:condensin complex subunit 3-like isoform X2 n=1 Tax=Harmonia axyridis TaxID=115357 RepID=UPI001E274EF4|nr:condensin complex subunit 3-like isoform X2 [Harmonia axyridis]
MSMKEIFSVALSKAQEEKFCCKKIIKLVENAFDKSKLEELLQAYIDALYNCYYSDDYADKNPYISRTLEFLAKIAIKITLKCIEPMEIADTNGTTSQVYDITFDPFFLNILKASLKFACVGKKEVRFNTCYFIMTLLQNIGNNVEMDYSVCNIILDSLVELLHDTKTSVRIQAIKALVRLQEPSNAECVVLKSFWMLFNDQNSEVRKVVINYIAPHPQSYSKIRMRLSDTDLGVRQAAYAKLADTNPKLYLKIIDRNIILTSGLADTNKKIKHILTEKLLPKWLSHFEGNYLLFFRALRLDADENDINNFEKLCSKLSNILLGRNSLTDIVKNLPVSKEEKVIPIQQLRLECVFFWSNVISHLRKIEDEEDYLQNILPELTTFSNYIERVIKEKTSVTMDEWENLEFQNVVFQLFQISSGFDMSDEVGRKTLYALILKILTTNKFQQKLINKIVQVASQLNSDVNSLTIDLCQVISEIREPLIDEVPSEDKLRKQKFEITQLRVKIHQLEIDEEEALKKKDFQHAHIVQNEIKESQRKLDSLNNMLYSVSEKVRVSKDDPETICRCLDILIGLLKIPTITVMSPALQSCRDEFLMPLLSNNTSEIHWRFILCLGLFSIMDRDLAFQHANFLCLPIATYRAIQNYDKIALKTSVACVTDLICMYGVKVIGMQENSQTDLNQDTNPIASRRKLYSEDLNEPEILNKDDITIEFIIDIILDMLNDEDEEVRCTATTSICKLIAHDFPINSDIICRLILKWYNPETEKQDPKLHQQLGSIIECFTNLTKGAKRIVQRAVVPIISSIVNAPGTSPLLEIDIENVLRLLAALTCTVNDKDEENIHGEIAVDLVERISKKPNEACTSYLVKLLTYLTMKFKDIEECKKMIASVELLVDDLVDKIPKKNLIKFRDKLNDGLRRATTGEKEEDKNETNTVNGFTSISHVTNGNSENESSLAKLSMINEESNNESQEQLENNDILEKDQEYNPKRNIRESIEKRDKNDKNHGQLEDSHCYSKGNSQSPSKEGSVENCSDETVENQKSTRSGRKLLMRGVSKILKGKGKLQKISEGDEENKKSKSSEGTVENAKAENEESLRKSISVDVSRRSIGENLIYEKYDYTSEEKTENSDETPKKTSNKKTNSKNSKIQIISQVVLRKDNKTQSIDSFTSVDISKRKLRKYKTPSDNGSTSTCDKPDNKKKQLQRNTSFTSKFNDDVTSQSVKEKITSKGSPKQNKEKRSAETPLSITVNRKSKRHLRGTTTEETPRKLVTNTKENPSSPFRKKDTNTPLSVGKRSSKRFSNIPSVSNKINRKKSLPSLTVRRSLRKRLTNSSLSNNPYRKSFTTTPKTASRNEPKKLSKMKEAPKEQDQTQPNTPKQYNVHNKIHNLRRTKMSEKLSESPSEVSSMESLNKKTLRSQKQDPVVEISKTKINPNTVNRNDRVESKQMFKTKKKADNSKSVKNLGETSKKHKKDTFLGKEQIKDKKGNKNACSSQEVENGVLQNLNSVMNKMNNSPTNRRSSRIEKSGNKHESKDKNKTKELNLSSSVLTRSRLSNRLSKSNGSRKQLDFSSDADETILKTFLQGDEEIVTENISIEEDNSFSNLSRDSKKENLSISINPSNTSRRSSLRKRNRQDDSPVSAESVPRKKMMGTKYKKNLQRVGQ